MKFAVAVLLLPAAMAVDVVAPGYTNVRELQGGACSVDGLGVGKMAICHGTASLETNPYNLLCVDNDSTCDAEDGCDSSNCPPGTLVEDCCAMSSAPDVRKLQGGPAGQTMCGGHGSVMHNSGNMGNKLEDIILAFEASDLPSEAMIEIPCPTDPEKTCYLDETCAVTHKNGMEGDPHIKNFVGEWFEYMGECDLVLAQAEKFDGVHDLHIHVRTTIRYDYSFIESAAVQIGKDVLEVDSFGNYALNDVTDAEQTYGGKVPKIGGYPVYKQILNTHQNKHQFDIVLDGTQNITISNMKDIVSINIVHQDNHLWQNIAGVMGHANGKMLARDGVTDMHDDIDNLANEWQVRASDPQLFRTIRAPQHPQKCLLPNKEAKEARRLGEGISEEAAAEACKRFTGATFQACVYDVTATNDLDMADSGAY